MKTILILILLTGLSGMLRAQSVVAVVSSSGNSSFYQQIDSAIFYASAGDIVYLPGGNFNIGTLVIDKAVHDIGAGHYPDSSVATGITYLNGHIRITDAASNGSLSGIFLSGDLFYGSSTSDMAVQNYNIYRCSVNNVSLSFDGSAYNSSSLNTQFFHNVVRGNFNGGDARGLYLRNNIFVGGYYHLYFVTSAEVSHNIFINGTFNDYVSGTTFTDNVFVAGMGGNASPNTSSNNVYLNNIYVNTALSQGGNGAILVSNNVQLTATDIFVNLSGTTFNYNDDYHLQATVSNFITAYDLTETGIYGSTNPYKAGALPMNPHIQSKNIGNATNPSGAISIDIKVNAQQN